MPFTFHAAWLTSGKHSADGQEQDAFSVAQVSRVAGQGDVQTVQNEGASDGSPGPVVQEAVGQKGKPGGTDSSRGPAPDSGPRLFLWGENHDPPSVWEERELDENGARENGERADVSGTHTPIGPTEEARNGRSQVSRGNGKIPSHPAQMPVGTLRQILRQLATASELTSLLGSPATASVWLPS